MESTNWFLFTDVLLIAKPSKGAQKFKIENLVILSTLPLLWEVKGKEANKLQQFAFSIVLPDRANVKITVCLKSKDERQAMMDLLSSYIAEYMSEHERKALLLSGGKGLAMKGETGNIVVEEKDKDRPIFFEELLQEGKDPLGEDLSRKERDKIQFESKLLRRVGIEKEDNVFEKLKKGQRGHELDRKGMFTALRNRDMNAVKGFLDQSAEYCHIRDKRDASPLHIACQTGHLEAIHLLIDQGSDLSQKDKKGNTPFHWFCRAKYDSVREAELLLESFSDAIDEGFDIFFSFVFFCFLLFCFVLFSFLFFSFLFFSFLFFSFLFFSFLSFPFLFLFFSFLFFFLFFVFSNFLTRFVDFDSTEERGNTCLHCCIQGEGEGQLANWLIKKGKCDPNAQNKAGETPLYLAVQLNCLSAVKVIMTGGGDVWVKTATNDTAVDAAHEVGNQKIMDEVLSRLNNPNWKRPPPPKKPVANNTILANSMGTKLFASKDTKVVSLKFLKLSNLYLNIIFRGGVLLRQVTNNRSGLRSGYNLQQVPLSTSQEKTSNSCPFFPFILRNHSSLSFFFSRYSSRLPNPRSNSSTSPSSDLSSSDNSLTSFDSSSSLPTISVEDGVLNFSSFFPPSFFCCFLLSFSFLFPFSFSLDNYPL